MEDRKKKLIEALKAEKIRLMAKGNDGAEHNAAIDYLITGTVFNNPDEYPLLDACLNDYDTLLTDYDC